MSDSTSGPQCWFLNWLYCYELISELKHISSSTAGNRTPISGSPTTGTRYAFYFDLCPSTTPTFPRQPVFVLGESPSTHECIVKKSSQRSPCGVTEGNELEIYRHSSRSGRRMGDLLMRPLSFPNERINYFTYYCTAILVVPVYCSTYSQTIYSINSN